MANSSRLYLTAYNLVQFIGFSSVTYYLLHALLFDSNIISAKQIYQAISPRFTFFQTLQFIEVLHVLIGLTGGSPLISFVQIGGRNLILHILINDIAAVQSKWFVPWLILAWSSIECFRYPFYISSLLNYKIKLITFLRYTAWYPIYPAGIILEALTIKSSLESLEASGKYSVSLPNSANFSFHLPTLLQLYLKLLIWPTSFLLLSHMYKQSKNALK
ncbi:very-long-chain (3R)-3-hydroxyacyl-CoA dehydratase [Tetranychus urticae]|uniref:Very-long-chain (3R)-3-hydroxyacyl-CoA dehydratase n=1 Tax=Tetranychus urticae TaxID=32264 RepID=T1KXE2_TETUR|nr:very-long-chain (3R)-3-hydroxyacyl-CoA dehydratase [Tetranychus urticae]